MTAQQVFFKLVEIMEADNGCPMPFTLSSMHSATPYIETLLSNGYFQDCPDCLESSFWQAAAGELEEADQFFTKNSETTEAYHELDNVLDGIFNGNW